LRRAYKVVIADVDPDVEGEQQCGSMDVEERNLFARTVTTRADVVVAVGHPGVKGMHRLVRLVEALAEHHVEPARIVPVVNRAPRNPRARAELTTAFADLTRSTLGKTAFAGPVFVTDRKRLEEVVTDGARLPDAVVSPVAGAVSAALERADAVAAPSPEPLVLEPAAVAPGTLGVWAEDDDA
jgi:hypothetical protein